MIADFDAYPAWAKGVKSAEVVQEYATAAPSRCDFELDAAPIKD